ITLSPRCRSSCPMPSNSLRVSRKNRRFTATPPINGTFARFSITSQTPNGPLPFAPSGLREGSSRLSRATTRTSARKAPRPIEFRGSITPRSSAWFASQSFACSRICRPAHGRVTVSLTVNPSPCVLSPSSSLATSRTISPSFATDTSKGKNTNAPLDARLSLSDSRSHAYGRLRARSTAADLPLQDVARAGGSRQASRPHRRLQENFHGRRKGHGRRHASLDAPQSRRPLGLADPRPDGQLHGLLQAGPRRETRHRSRQLARTPENRHRLARRHLRLRSAARRSAQSIRNCRPLSRGDVSVPARQASRAAETTRNGKRLLPHRERSREFHFSS